MSEGITSNQLQSGVVTVFSRTVEMNNAQIKTLPTIPFEIAPAPGAGKMIIPIGGYVRLDIQAGGYAVTGAPIWQLVHMASPITREISGFVDVASSIAVPGTYSAPIPALSSYNSVEGYLSWGLTGDTGERINVPLGIQDKYNGVSNYTLGHVDNSLRVSVIYTIIDV